MSYKKPIALVPLLVLVICFGGCKKDRLEGDAAALIGTWEWQTTSEVTNHCDPESLWTSTVIDASGDGNRYTLEFLERGKVIFSHNDGVVWKHRIVLNTVESSEDEAYDRHFVIWLNNRSNDELELWLREDTLMLNDYPKDTEADCVERFNYFLRGER